MLTGRRSNTGIPWGMARVLKVGQLPRSDHHRAIGEPHHNAINALRDDATLSAGHFDLCLLRVRLRRVSDGHPAGHDMSRIQRDRIEIGQYAHRIIKSHVPVIAARLDAGPNGPSRRHPHRAKHQDRQHASPHTHGGTRPLAQLGWQVVGFDDTRATPYERTSMNGLDIISLADAVTGAKNMQAAWRAFAGQLARQGLARTALHDGLDLQAENPFRHPRHCFGNIWDADYDAKVRSHQGGVRNSTDPDLAHLKPTLMFLSRFTSPLLIEHRDFLDGPRHTAFTPLCRHLVETKGQHHALALPLVGPVSGRVSILSAWGDEDNAELGRYLRAHAALLQMAGQAFLSLLTDPGEGPALSHRERQVLALLAEGIRTGAVADALSISERSVREYMRRAQAKLDAPTRTAAVARAIRRGLI